MLRERRERQQQCPRIFSFPKWGSSGIISAGGERMESAEIVVIGAGPAGIAVGVEGARAGIERIVILEKAVHPCDTIVSLYREGKRVDAVYRNVSVAPQG